MGSVNNFLSLNMIKENNSKIANYDLSDLEVSIEFRINYKKQVLIIGRLDNNYICWYSITNIDDVENNSAIFNYLANKRPELISDEYNANPDKYEDISTWLTGKIYRINTNGGKWATPFGCNYGLVNEKLHGKFFAGDIKSYYDKNINLCEWRNLNNNYVEILKDYYEKLNLKNKGFDYYLEVKPIIAILRSESYLTLSIDKELREIYLRCIKVANSLYNIYMTVIR